MISLPPLMNIIELRVDSSAGTDDLTPPSGGRVQVFGIWTGITITNALTSTLRGTLAFGTGHTTDTSKILIAHRLMKGDDTHCCYIGGINVLGDADEKVRLTNITYSGGNAICRCVVYYRIK